MLQNILFDPTQNNLTLRLMVVLYFQRPYSAPDQVMLERLFIKDEEESLKEDRSAVSEGKSKDLIFLITKDYIMCLISTIYNSFLKTIYNMVM